MHKILALFFLFCGLTVLAQDSALVRSFDEKQLEEYTSNEQYQYTAPDEPTEGPNAFLQFLGDLLKALGEFLTTKAGVATIVILIVFGILFGFRNSIFKRKKKDNSAPDYIPNVVNKEGINFQQLRKEIQLAEESGDYKSAIRNLYALVILSLADSKLIKLHLEKTNTDYRKELPKKLQASFKRLTTIFDYVWYGDYEASAALLEQAKQYAKSLNLHKDAA